MDQVVIIAGALGVWPISVDHLRINNDNPGERDGSVGEGSCHQT